MALFTRRKTPETTSRIVRTSRWIHVNQLELGMYVSELDLPWSDTRFRFQGFRIESMDTLRELQRVWHQRDDRVGEAGGRSDARSVAALCGHESVAQDRPGAVTSAAPAHRAPARSRPARQHRQASRSWCRSLRS